MPQQGETRTANGETRAWSGTRWEPVAAPQTVDQPKSFGALDYVPGLRDILNIPSNVVKGAQALPDVARGLIHEPGATLKGFGEGVSEAATPGRVGLLALLTGGATIPAALGAAGGESLAQAGRVATDAPNAPQSFPEAAGNVLEAASVPAVAGAVQAIPAGVARLGGSKNVANRLIGAGLGGYAGYKADGPLGALGGAAAGAMGVKTMQGLARAALGLGGETAAVAAPAIAESVAPAAAETAAADVPDTVLSGIRLSPDAVARNIEATNLRDVEGYSQNMAGKLAGIPGAGESRLVPDTHLGDTAITDEMIQNRGGTVTPPPSPAEPLIDPREPPVSTSMQGLERAIRSRLPSAWGNLPSDEEMDADILARNASGKWNR